MNNVSPPLQSICESALVHSTCIEHHHGGKAASENVDCACTSPHPASTPKQTQYHLRHRLLPRHALKSMRMDIYSAPLSQVALSSESTAIQPEHHMPRDGRENPGWYKSPSNSCASPSTDARICRPLRRTPVYEIGIFSYARNRHLPSLWGAPFSRRSFSFQANSTVLSDRCSTLGVGGGGDMVPYCPIALRA